MVRRGYLSSHPSGIPVQFRKNPGRSRKKWWGEHPSVSRQWKGFCKMGRGQVPLEYNTVHVVRAHWLGMCLSHRDQPRAQARSGFSQHQKNLMADPRDRPLPSFSQEP